MPIWAAGITAAASLAGGAYAQNRSSAAQAATNNTNANLSYAQNVWNAAQVEKANDFNAWQSDKAQAFESWEAQKMRGFQEASNAKQMEFQERMSSTAHQREVEDLRKAGLNPILSGTGGMGSSTPGGASSSGAMARGNAAHSSPSSGAAPQASAYRTLDFVSPAISSALSTANTLAGISKAEAETERIKAEVPLVKMQTAEVEAKVDNLLADTTLKEALKDKTVEEKKVVENEVRRTFESIYSQYWDWVLKKENVMLSRSQTGLTRAEARTKVVNADADEWAAEYGLPKIKRALEVTGLVSNQISDIANAIWVSVRKAILPSKSK